MLPTKVAACFLRHLTYNLCFFASNQPWACLVKVHKHPVDLVVLWTGLFSSVFFWFGIGRVIATLDFFHTHNFDITLNLPFLHSVPLRYIQNGLTGWNLAWPHITSGLVSMVPFRMHYHYIPLGMALWVPVLRKWGRHFTVLLPRITLFMPLLCECVFCAFVATCLVEALVMITSCRMFRM